MTIFENKRDLGNSIIADTYFLLPNHSANSFSPVRRTVYKYQGESGDGSVVAWNDYGKGSSINLFVESMFFQLHRYEPEMETIKIDSGIYSERYISLFDMGGTK